MTNSLPSVCVHVIVILLVVARGYIVQPLLVVEIPADGLLDTLLKLERGFPTEFLLEFRTIDGIAQVVTGTVGDEGDEVHILAFLSAEQAINGVDKHLDDVNVLPLVEAADVVGVSNLALVEYEVDGTGMGTDRVRSCSNSWSRQQACHRYHGRRAQSGLKMPLMHYKVNGDCTS